MLFSCGVGNELFYFGVAEPIYHYAASAHKGRPNQYSHMNPTERAQRAMNMTYYHWGLHGWVVYCIIGLAIAFMGYRKKLPLTMRSCLYPLLGDKAFGKIGDFVDILSAICTMMGICTSLGLGVIDVNAGIHRLAGCDQYAEVDCREASPQCEWNPLGMCKSTCEYIATKAECQARINQDDGVGCRWNKGHCEMLPSSDGALGFPITRDNLIILIWIITIFATTSAVSGLKLGVRALSVTCFGLGMFLWGYVFFSGNPWYFLDLFCQQIGMYIHNFILLGFHTDSFVRHTHTPDVDIGTGNHEAMSQNPTAHAETEAASSEWMGHWTMFYWGWWVAWSPFVGMFIAKISKGRTIKEFINYTMTIPILYTFFWLTVF